MDTLAGEYFRERGEGLVAKKRRGFKGMYIILISSIIGLNLMGVGYSFWNEGLQVKTSVSTGEIEIELEEYSIEGDLGEGTGLMINFENDTININGEIPVGYRGGLNYYIRNKGNLPIVINGEKVEPEGISNEQRVIIETDFDNLESLLIGEFLAVEQFNE